MTSITAESEARVITPSDLIDSGDVAELLGLDRSTVNRRAKAGTLPVLAQLRSGVYVFDLSEIKALAS